MINAASFRYPKEPQIHFVASEKDLTLSDILRALEQENFKIVRVKEAKSKEELLHEIATLMTFPDYFGRNWDALEECLSDLSWLSARGYVVIMPMAEGFLESNPKEFETVLDIMRKVIQVWRSDDVPFHVVFLGSDKLRRWLHMRCSEDEFSEWPES